MCRKFVKKLFLLLLLVSCYSAQVFAQEDTEDLEYFNRVASDLTGQQLNSSVESQTLSQSSQTELETLNSLSQISTKQDVSQMSSMEVLDNFENWIAQQERDLAMRESMYKNLESEYYSMKSILNDSKQKCQDLRKALASNKDDTKYIYELWAQAKEDIKMLEERVAFAEKSNNRQFVIGTVLSTLPGLAWMGAGLYEYHKQRIDQETFFKKFVIPGAVASTGFCFVYRGGHLKLHLW